ncbi:MAG: TetR/AcrR family transcriptional regulator, partial [Actinomycetota bacterium]|nr:TetR/AcrR family transcriptional regulator [Actinomycetota bacterium]
GKAVQRGMPEAIELSGTQEQILDAVISCIVEGGIAGVSMRAVAEEANVSLGLLNYHFAGKQSLINAAFRLACDRLQVTALEALDGVVGAEERVRAFVRGSVQEEFLTPEYLRLRLVLWAAGRLDPEIGDADLRLYEAYVTRMAALIAEACPGAPADEARTRADDVALFQNGLWLNWARFGDRGTLERGLRRCEEIALGHS